MTLNLQGIKKGTSRIETKPAETNGSIPATPERTVTEEELRKTWSEYAEQRKDQLAEYHLLVQTFELAGTQIKLQLTNPVQEPLLESIKTPLTAYLREKLNNNTISITGVLQEQDTRKVIYTNKEKFEHLAEKNPILLELKERLGLDPDF